MLEFGGILREIRESQGLSQRRLAVRAATSQSAISRIERGVETPSLERFTRLVEVMGYRPVIDVQRMKCSVSADDLAVAAAMTPAERFREAISWNRLASQLAQAGERARREADAEELVGRY